MKAIARRRRSATYQHDLKVRDHVVSADEPREAGGDDTAPSPQEYLAVSLASCTAITLEMYADRKGWEVGPVEVECEYSPAERGWPTCSSVIVRLPVGLTREQVDRLLVTAAKGPVQRMLDDEVMLDERVEI